MHICAYTVYNILACIFCINVHISCIFLAFFRRTDSTELIWGLSCIFHAYSRTFLHINCIFEHITCILLAHCMQFFCIFIAYSHIFLHIISIYLAYFVHISGIFQHISCIFHAYSHTFLHIIIIFMHTTIVATEVLGRWEKKRKKEYPGARP
jgi:hypothetical protein